MEPNLQNNNVGGSSQNGYQQNPNQFTYQQNFNGFNAQNSKGASFREGLSGAIGEAKEALSNKVVAQSFIFMVAALVITAIGSFVAADVLLNWLIEKPALLIGLVVGEVVIVIVSNIALKRNNVVLSAVLLTAYSFINGATIGILCRYAYEPASVTRVFVITAVMFAVTAFFGLVTKKDVSSLGSLCVMGLVGLIVMSIVNLFFNSEPMYYLISGVGVLVFVGLTAYDTRKIKEKVAFATEENVTALSLNGAFELYLDFINLFLYLLRLFGKRR